MAVLILAALTWAARGEAAAICRRALRSCGAVFELDETAEPTDPWTCNRCGADNVVDNMLELDQLDAVERGIRMQWERHPHTRPETIAQWVDERTSWAQELERQLAEARDELARAQETGPITPSEAEGLRSLLAHMRRYGATVARRVARRRR